MTRVRQSEWRRRGIGGCTDQTFDGQVSANADDGYCTDPNCADGGAPFCGRDGADTVYDMFQRFLNVTIPAGARIDVAYLTVEQTSDTRDGSGVKVNINGEDADDPSVPASRADLDGRARTTASVAWDDIDFTTGTPTNSPDISTIIQEIVDRGGWNSGQAMQLFIEDDVSDTNKLYNFEANDGTEEAVKLHVEYCG